MQAQSEHEMHEATAKATDAEVPLPEQELQVALRTDSVALQIKLDKQKILDHMEKTRSAVKKEGAGAKLDEHDRRLQACEDRLEARKEELRHELIERKRQDAATGLAALAQKINVLKGQDDVMQKKVKELELEARQAGRSSIEVEMMRSDILALQEVLSHLAAELERTRVELQPDSKNGSARVTLLCE